MKVVLPEPDTSGLSLRTTGERLGCDDLPAMPTQTIAVGRVSAILADLRGSITVVDVAYYKL